MKKHYEGTELWPFDSSTSSTASTPKRSERQAETLQKTQVTSGDGASSIKQPVTYSAFGVTISTFKGSNCFLLNMFNGYFFCFYV